MFRWRPSQREEPGKGIHTEDAYFAISNFSTWINNADTKAGFLVAAWTVLVGALATSGDRIQRALPVAGGRSLAALVFLILSLSCLSVTAYFLYSALSPRLPAPGFSRFAFPNVANAKLRDLINADPSRSREEAWRQARQLAQIALAKFLAVKRALRFLMSSAVMALVWSFLAK